MPRPLRTPHFPLVELLDQRRARYHVSGTQVWTIYDVAIAAGTVTRLRLGAAAASGRAFVPPNGGKLLYLFHHESTRDLEVPTLQHQLASAGWMHLVLKGSGDDPR